MTKVHSEQDLMTFSSSRVKRSEGCNPFVNQLKIHDGQDNKMKKSEPKIEISRSPDKEMHLAMMTLYSGTTDPYSHRCRFVLFEKSMNFKVIDVDIFNKPEILAAINPDNNVPVLVERDLVLNDANIINEYLDERFPHPQLLSPDPKIRALTRLFLHRFEKELFCHIDAIENGSQMIADKARRTMRDNLTQFSDLFAKQKYMLGNEFSMVDVAIAPLLWRLDHYGVELGKEASPLLMEYAERIFLRPAFIKATTPAEKAMRK
jgi:RNA polymerase-associated protein